MSHQYASGRRTPLGVGRLLAESFSIFFRNVPKMIAIAGLPSLAGILLVAAIGGFDVALGRELPAFGTPEGVFVYLSGLAVNMALFGLTAGLLVLFAYDLKQGRTRPVAGYLAATLRCIVPLVVLAMATTLLIGVGFILLIVPGMWVYAVLSVTFPAVAIERAGFGALRRSARLTKGYRWPIAGVLFVIGICAYGLLLAAGFGMQALGETGGGWVVAATALANAFFSGIAYGLTAVTVVLIYARLREIKEGATTSDLAAVFD
ncbi:hypothetical protein [Albimonas pacifica]|uniref:Membrane domain of glycerophosphoryl diester phosphodiesterase n=1 Tax=Albimonas pacifica TaxID=1114924 RepID=A0A1I3CH81_9RHOB|nr:hypothetical protein [Albimonas pacifica]SFH73920.1 hypothetical protein SAMN05216258_1023 [Albimonas pacifica]